MFRNSRALEALSDSMNLLRPNEGRIISIQPYPNPGRTRKNGNRPQAFLKTNLRMATLRTTPIMQKLTTEALPP